MPASVPFVSSTVAEKQLKEKIQLVIIILVILNTKQLLDEVEQNIVSCQWRADQLPTDADADVRESRTASGTEVNFFSLTRFDTIASVTASHQTSKQEFSSLRQVAETVQQKEHLTSGCPFVAHGRLCLSSLFCKKRVQ